MPKYRVTVRRKIIEYTTEQPSEAAALEAHIDQHGPLETHDMIAIDEKEPPQRKPE